MTIEPDCGASLATVKQLFRETVIPWEKVLGSIDDRREVRKWARIEVATKAGFLHDEMEVDDEALRRNVLLVARWRGVLIGRHQRPAGWHV